MIFSQFWQADFVTSPVYLIFKFPVTMGENIRIFHIEIIHLIGCNITTVIVIIFTKNTFELLNQLISEIRTYLNSGTNSLMRSKPASEDKSPPSKFILICLLLSNDKVFTILIKGSFCWYYLRFDILILSQVDALFSFT